jgi:hypothetical protein
MKFHASLLGALALAVSAQTVTAQTPAPPATKHVRVAASGAKLRNLASPVGEVVLDAKADTLLAVRDERSGWLEVEPVTAMKVWVYGTYLKPTTTSGVAEVNANSVRMRPLPSSDERSFPLPMKLDRGDRVRVVRRHDPSKPLAEDWVQVWSPAGATAWVSASETKPLAAGEDARSAWAADLKTALAAMPVVDVFAADAASGAGTAAKASAPNTATKEAPAKADPKLQVAYDKLAEGEKLLKSAQASDLPDFTAAKAAFSAAIAATPQGSSADSARARLEEIAIREEMVRIKADKQKLESERTEKLAEAEAKLGEVRRRQDPLRGRYQARGWLERQEQAGLPSRYAVTWGGRELAEVVCTGGRYELDAFVGCEVGILGVTQRAPVPATADAMGTPGRVNATKIEVISARSGR